MVRNIMMYREILHAVVSQCVFLKCCGVAGLQSIQSEFMYFVLDLGLKGHARNLIALLSSTHLMQSLCQILMSSIKKCKKKSIQPDFMYN